MKKGKNLEKLGSLLLVLSACTSRVPAAGAGLFNPIDITQVKVEGEIGRRIDNTMNNNVLVLDTDKDFLQPFQRRNRSGGYIGLTSSLTR